VLCSTNAIESLNARYRRAVKARGHFPSEQAAIKCLYLVTRSLDPTDTSRARPVSTPQRMRRLRVRSLPALPNGCLDMPQQIDSGPSPAEVSAREISRGRWHTWSRRARRSSSTPNCLS
jgi:Transposase, Mutator family